MIAFARFSLALCALTVSMAMAFAQTSIVSMPRSSVTTQSRTHTQTVSAIVGNIDTATRTVRLQLLPDISGGTSMETVTAVQEAACIPLRNGRPATLADFSMGEQVVARLTWRTSPERVVVLRDLYDTSSYAERQRQGKETCVGILRTFTATELSVQRADGITVAFQVSDKTRLVKNDAPASADMFVPGRTVAVKPRRLPGGDLLASIVGGTAQEVAWAYRDTLTTWSGIVTQIQGEERNGAVITLRRDDGAERRFLFPVGARFVQGSSLLSWRYLSGASVRVHLMKSVEQKGMRYADEVKIVSRRTSKTTIREESLDEP